MKGTTTRGEKWRALIAQTDKMDCSTEYNWMLSTHERYMMGHERASVVNTYIACVMILHGGHSLSHCMHVIASSLIKLVYDRVFGLIRRN